MGSNGERKDRELGTQRGRKGEKRGEEWLGGKLDNTLLQLTSDHTWM